MAKRAKLEIIKDILQIVQEHRNQIKVTPLLRKSNISSNRFKNYLKELQEKELIINRSGPIGEKFIALTEKGNRFLEKYKTIVNFIDEFDL
jgi:predicted transcriptional regulator